MKVKFLLVVIMILLYGNSYAQTTPDTYKKVYKIFYGQDQNIKFSLKEKEKAPEDSINIKKNKQSEKLPVETKDEFLSLRTLETNNFDIQPNCKKPFSWIWSKYCKKPKDYFTLYSSVKLKEDTLQYFIWKYKLVDSEDKKKKANHFIDKHIVYEIIEKGNYKKLKSNLFYIGAMTIPLKWYLGEKGDTLSDSRIKFNANVGLVFGLKNQWSRVSNLWEEDTLKVTSVSGTSHNFIFGINQTQFNQENNVNFQGDKKRDVPAVSLAYGFGYHINSFYIMGTCGFDIPLSHYNKGWKYQGIPWVGFGVGLGLESIGIGVSGLNK